MTIDKVIAFLKWVRMFLVIHSIYRYFDIIYCIVILFPHIYQFSIHVDLVCRTTTFTIMLYAIYQVYGFINFVIFFASCVQQVYVTRNTWPKSAKKTSEKNQPIL